MNTEKANRNVRRVELLVDMVKLTYPYLYALAPEAEIEKFEKLMLELDELSKPLEPR